MNEQQIRQIAQTVYQENQTKGQFSTVKIPLHTHNGVDNQKISQSNVTPGTRINSGTITFSQIARYTLGIIFNPTSIQFYGIVVDSLTAPTIRAQCVGTALLGGSYYLQPQSSTSVTTNGNVKNITQSSSYLVVDNSGVSPAFHALADQNALVDVEYPVNTYHARMIVESFTTEGIILNVTNLDSGWSIVGEFIIT